jgi:uncharacterized RDD family membrane protein YckC
MRYPYTGKRIGATLVDYIFTFCLTFLYIVSFGENDGLGHYSVSGFATLPLFLFWFIYFIVAEWYTGNTMGHYLFGLKVVPVEGQHLGFSQVTLRRICDVVDICWCFGLIAFLLVKTTQHNQRLGDLLAKTEVVGHNDKRMTADLDFEKS